MQMQKLAIKVTLHSLLFRSKKYTACSHEFSFQKAELMKEQKAKIVSNHPADQQCGATTSLWNDSWMLSLKTFSLEDKAKLKSLDVNDSQSAFFGTKASETSNHPLITQSDVDGSLHHACVLGGTHHGNEIVNYHAY